MHCWPSQLVAAVSTCCCHSHPDQLPLSVLAAVGLDTSTLGDEEAGSMDTSFAPQHMDKPYMPSRPSHMMGGPRLAPLPGGGGDPSIFAVRPRSPRDVSLNMGHPGI